MKLKGFRKFIVVIFCVILSAVLLVFNKLSGDNFVEIVKWTAGFFVGGNVIEHIKDKINIGGKNG